MENYVRLLEFLKLHFPFLFSVNKLAVSCDGDKRLRPAIFTCLLNSVYVSCNRRLLNLVSRSGTGPGRIERRRTKLWWTKEPLNQEIDNWNISWMHRWKLDTYMMSSGPSILYQESFWEDSLSSCRGVLIFICFPMESETAANGKCLSVNQQNATKDATNN